MANWTPNDREAWLEIGVSSYEEVMSLTWILISSSIWSVVYLYSSKTSFLPLWNSRSISPFKSPISIQSFFYCRYTLRSFEIIPRKFPQNLRPFTVMFPSPVALLALLPFVSAQSTISLFLPGFGEGNVPLVASVKDAVRNPFAFF